MSTFAALSRNSTITSSHACLYSTPSDAPFFRLGTLLVCHYLELWGCPPGLVAELALPLEQALDRAGDGDSSGRGGGGRDGTGDDGSGRGDGGRDGDGSVCLPSRPLLLALAWLTGHCRLYEQELLRLHPVGPLRPLLPPLPEVRGSCCWDYCCLLPTSDPSFSGERGICLPLGSFHPPSPWLFLCCTGQPPGC